jgi:hypothetical protein
MYETQGKVLEHALESLETERQDKKEPPRPMNDQSAGPIQKYALMMLLDTLDLDKSAEYIARVKPTVYALEYIYQKPLKECSMKEVVDGLALTARALNWYDRVDVAEERDHYTLRITHSLSPNASQIIRMVDETVLDTYGADVESLVSDNSVSHIIRKANERPAP